MSSARLFRPLARALARQPQLTARPAAFLSTKTVAQSASAQLTSARVAKEDAKPAAFPKLTVLAAGMPQLVPFYFVNEATVAFICLPALIYLFSKYLLPQRVRVMAARLFISKL
ncbi:hypothetical protein EJ06DRAFT_532269 [Trichodelitschia bisporula]|uniref:ATP synthase protein 8 n=1 Tax=Trichodelitschia bisporula TaxID=703511 RepID=A0A6G1HS17_9PEZI|nr:hypothetical protein EJ06DRAFT_532269 [Trichodelitschia bisporula]